MAELATLPTSARAQELLEVLAGPAARLRPEQAEAIDAVVTDRRRTLVVARTGFGKSAIYFIATRLLRDAGAGPTLVVSPLLALMRDQVAAASRMGIRSATINSTNPEEWAAIGSAVAAGDVDLLCISPERLNNPGFVARVLPRLASGLGLLVVDEAHCISDWGHDFRPDYRRIRTAIANLAPRTPVLATTATANQRVSDDVAEQLGDDVLVRRSTLERRSLVLGVASPGDLAHRLAWVAGRVADLPGTGIVYCLTVEAVERTAEYLSSVGIDAAAYTGRTDPDERARLEAAFKANDVKAVVATSALGMGVDKPDVAFVFHLGAPPSPVAYYQQVGRAGRALDQAEAWLLPGAEDAAIWEWFASVGLPPEPLVRRVLDALAAGPMSLVELEAAVDLRRTRLEALLKVLDVDGAVTRDGSTWSATGVAWRYDTDRIERIRAARSAEADAMVDYARGDECLMLFLRRALDDPGATTCGRCWVCRTAGGEASPAATPPGRQLVAAAATALRAAEVVIEPRKQWPRGTTLVRGNIAPARRAEEGRALARAGDAGWAPVVVRAFDTGTVADELVDGIAAALKRWPWTARPTWVTWVPSRTRGDLVGQVAARLGALGRLTVVEAVSRTAERPPQGHLANSAHRLANVWDAFTVDPAAVPHAGPVLLLDDEYDSGWTITVVAALLRDAGSGPVLPFALLRR